ncbi:Afadin-like isoform X2 [Oopsacas minuta]|uniref:Afadin-like isoform X2 n=1 Tax=Oopsacas minuta TaxID=111878 RepID=A0AAV7JBA6_9METZ|nr:Afadin-like isoform X2 [Oopsacas minuta]
MAMDKRKKKLSSQNSISGKNCEEEHARLCEIIAKWNQERFSLFEISLPNESLEFSGVIRFFYRDSKGPFNTKCIKVSSKDTCQHLIEILVEKFRPDMKMLSNPQDFSLSEIFPNGERRSLTREEKPLLSQLNWNRDEREGYFLLGQTNSEQNEICKQQVDLTLFQKKDKVKKKKSRMSIRFPKSFSKSYRVTGGESKSKPSTPLPPASCQSSQSSGVHLNNSSVTGKTNSEVFSQLEGMHLMRTLSNPEGVLRIRRERKLEEIKNALKDPGTTTIKIYAENLIPEVPYKTLLVTPEHTANDVIRITLEKYHMEREDPSDYCLVQYSLPSGASCITTTGRDECIVEPGDFPLHRFREHQANFPDLKVIFQLRKIDQAMLPKIIPQELRPLHPFDSYRSRSHKAKQSLPCFYPMRGGKPDKQHRIQVYANDFKMLVGSRRGFNQQADKYIALEGADILPEHCIVEGYKGVCRLIPTSRNGPVYIDNILIQKPTSLTSTCVVRFGRHYDFQFFLPDTIPSKSSTNITTYPLRGLHSVKSVDSDIETRPSSELGEYKKELLTLQRVLSDGAINEFSHLQRLSPHDDTPETIFMSDGKVISLSNYSSSNMDDFLPEELPKPVIPTSRNPRSSVRIKEEPLILPATLSFSLHSICHIIDCFITDVKYSDVTFKHAPAYALYICVRSFLNGDSLCDATLSERLQGMKEMLSCSASLLKATVAQSRHIPGPLAFWINNMSELLHFLRRDGEVSPHCPDVLTSLTQLTAYAFRSLSESICKEVEPHLTSLFSPAPSSPSQLLDTDSEPAESFLDMLWKPGGVASRLSSHNRSACSLFSILDAIYNLMASCNVNKEITRELFLRLIHFIGSTLFNDIVTDRSHTSPTSLSSLKPRLKWLQSWTEEKGLSSLFESCFSPCHQALTLLEECRATDADLNKLSNKANVLNPIQIKTLLETIQSRKIVSFISQIKDINSSPLLLQTKISRPIKIPDNGYSSETLLGIPHGLRDFLEPAIQKGLCKLHLVSLLSTGAWMKSSELASHRLSESRSSIESSSAPNLPPDYPGKGADPSLESLQPVSIRSSRGGSFPYHQDTNRYLELRLDKQDSDSIGISVVSYKIKNPFKSVILVKSILDNPALEDGRLEPGDQIIRVDDVNLEEPGMSQKQATHILRSTGRIVHLRILKKESVNLMLATTNLYYSENELSDSDSISLSKIYPYATTQRPGHKTLDRQRLPTPSIPVLKHKHMLAPRYEEEFQSPRSYNTQYPTFPRSHRSFEYSPSPRDKQLSILQGEMSPSIHNPSIIHGKDSLHSHNLHQFDTLYTAPHHMIDPYQPPSYTLQLVPTPHPHTHYDSLRHMVPHPQYTPPIHWDPIPDPSRIHKLPGSLTPAHSPTTTATTKVDLLSKLSRDEVALASSITLRERELQEVRANIELLRQQHEISPTQNPMNIDESGISPSHSATPLVGFQPSTHIQKQVSNPTPSKLHLLSSPLTLRPNTPSNYLGVPPDVIQSTLHTPVKTIPVSTTPASVPPALDLFLPLQFQESNLTQPMTLQDKMEYFIHKSSS